MEENKVLAAFIAHAEQRAWYSAGGRVDTDTPEGYVFDEFVTDMCWTCWYACFASNS